MFEKITQTLQIYISVEFDEVRPDDLSTIELKYGCIDESCS